MRQIIFIFGLLVLPLLIIGSCSKKSTVEPELTFEEELQRALDATRAVKNGIGASVSIVFADGQTWNGVSGVSHDNVPITQDMVFNIASVTKTFVAATVLQLMEEGELALEDSLYQYIHSYPNIDSTITIRQLLNHTCGVFDFWDHPSFFDSIRDDYARIWNPEDVLTSLVMAPYFRPGTDYAYSNTNYILLGMIIEEVTGNQVSAEIRNRILDPLGLNHTYFAVEEELEGNIAHGWADFSIPEDGVLDDLTTIPMEAFYSIEWTAGAMFSSADDIIRWSQALFQGEILQPSTMEQMLDFRPVSEEGSATNGYGLGISSVNPSLFQNSVTIGHGGENPGYRMAMLFFPEHNIYMTLMLNVADGECFWAISDALIEIILTQ